MSRFTFATWNVNNRRFRESHLVLLKQLRLDVLALQEVSEHFFHGLRAAALFDGGYYSMNYLHDKSGLPRSRRLGCAIFASGRIEVTNPSLVPRLPLPERSLVVEAKINLFEMKICSLHTPPGVSWGELKPRSHLMLAEWLERRDAPVILGIDANAPKVDHPEYGRNEWWWPDEAKLLGEDRIHDLRDAFREYIGCHADLLRSIRAQRPRGPLAVSYIRGNRHKLTESRYDFIFASPEFKVGEVKYLYHEAVEAGSDHALVFAEMEISEE